MSNLVKHDPAPKKNLAIGFLLGLIPGLGLFYAAPFVSAAVATVFVASVMVVVGWLKWIPLLGWLIKTVAMTGLALTSALMGLLYTNAYNQTGKRTALADKSDPDRLPL